MIMTVTVPTKQYDGGSNRASIANLATAPTRKVDAFAKYSNNLVRMKALLLLDEDDDDCLDYLGSLNEALRYASVGDHHAARSNQDHGTSTKRQKGNNSCPITQQEVLEERKTRISFELHPSLLLHDLLDLKISDPIPDDDEEEESKE